MDDTPILDHAETMWDPSHSYGEPASEKEIFDAEVRLGVRLPEILKRQLRAHDGGGVYRDEENDPFPAKRPVMQWLNAAADGLLEVRHWTLASLEDDLEDEDIDELDKLVLIAHHSESHLLLDYRECGPDGMPDILSVFYGEVPERVASLNEFVERTIESKTTSSHYASIAPANAPVPCYRCGYLLAQNAHTCPGCGEIFIP